MFQSSGDSSGRQVQLLAITAALSTVLLKVVWQAKVTEFSE